MNYSQIADAFKTIVLAFTALFPLVNPVGGAPIFLSLTRQYPQPVQRVLARKIAVYGFALLAGSLVFGTEILSFFGISLTVVQIAGGLVVAVTGWNLLNQNPQAAAPADSGTLEDALQHAFFPLTLPITVGPGCISVAITLGAHLRYQNDASHGFYFQFFGSAMIGMALVCLLVVVCYGNAARLLKLLGPSGTSILIRLSAFILLTLGVQIIWNGLESGLPQIFVKSH
jgi:multiple antibiotic resistance protein